MKVAMSEVVEMFQKLGFKAADGWDHEKVQKKVKKIKQLVEDVEIDPKIMDDPDHLLNRIVAAQDKGHKVIVMPDEGEKSKKGKVVSKDEYEGKKKDKKKKVVKRTSRIEAAAKFIQGLKKTTSRADIIDGADKTYVEAGGTANEKESQWAVRVVLEVMECLELVAISGTDVKPVKG